MSLDAKHEQARMAKDLAQRKQHNLLGVSVGGHAPDIPPTRAARPLPALYVTGSLVAVQDNRLRWHAALGGPGLLCGAVRNDLGVYTLTWSADLGLVDCQACLAEIVRRAEVAA